MTAIASANCAAPEGVVEVINPSGKGGFLLVCEHASNFIPPELNDLGLTSDVLQSHVAWDPGALAVAKEMSAQLNAPLVAQCVSRLVYDCNRPPEAESAMPAKSEIYDVPGNIGLTVAQRLARAEQYYVPFRQTLSAAINRQIELKLSPVLITIHSFTPVFLGKERHLDIGVLHDADSRFADELLISLEQEKDYVVRRNAPYGPEDGVTHTLAQSALPKGLLNSMFEIRNNLIDTQANQQKMAKILSMHVKEALAALKLKATEEGQ